MIAFSWSYTPLLEPAVSLSLCALELRECFSFSVYFPSAGPPAHRKETQLAGGRERQRGEREKEQDRGAERGRKRNAEGGKGQGLLMLLQGYERLADQFEKYIMYKH